MLLEDIIPVIVEIIEESGENVFSESLEDTVVSVLLSLECSYSNFDDLKLVQFIRKLISEQIIQSKKVPIQGCESLRGIDPIRKLITSTVSDAHRNLTNETAAFPADLLLLKYPNNDRNKKLKQTTSYSFNFDDLPPMGILSDVLDLLNPAVVAASAKNIVLDSEFDRSITAGLKLLLEFDPADLLEHPQWHDLVKCLTCLCQYSPQLSSNCLVHLFATLFRLLQAFDGQSQIDDVLKLSITVIFVMTQPLKIESLKDSSTMTRAREFITNQSANHVVKLLKETIKSCSTVCASFSNKTYDEITSLTLLCLCRSIGETHIPMLVAYALTCNSSKEWLGFLRSMHKFTLFFHSFECGLAHLIYRSLADWLSLQQDNIAIEESSSVYIKVLLFLLQSSLALLDSVPSNRSDLFGLLVDSALGRCSPSPQENQNTLSQLQIVPLDGTNGIFNGRHSALPVYNTSLKREDVEQFLEQLHLKAVSTVLSNMRKNTKIYDNFLEDLSIYQRQLLRSHNLSQHAEFPLLLSSTLCKEMLLIYGITSDPFLSTLRTYTKELVYSLTDNNLAMAKSLSDHSVRAVADLLHETIMQIIQQELFAQPLLFSRELFLLCWIALVELMHPHCANASTAGSSTVQHYFQEILVSMTAIAGRSTNDILKYIITTTDENAQGLSCLWVDSMLKIIVSFNSRDGLRDLIKGTAVFLRQDFLDQQVSTSCKNNKLSLLQFKLVTLLVKYASIGPAECEGYEDIHQILVVLFDLAMKSAEVLDFSVEDQERLLNLSGQLGESDDDRGDNSVRLVSEEDLKLLWEILH